MRQFFMSVNATVAPLAAARGAVATHLEDVKRNAVVEPRDLGARRRRQDEPY